MADEPQKPTFEQALLQAEFDARHLITFWQNIGVTEYRGEGAMFAYQILAAVLGGTVVGRWLETMAPDAAAAEAAKANERGFAAVTVPDDYVVLTAIMVARAHISGMVAMRRGEPATANVNEHMRLAAADVVKLFGEGTSPTIRRLAELDDAGMARQAELWRQRQTLAYDTPAGTA